MGSTRDLLGLRGFIGVPRFFWVGSVGILDISLEGPVLREVCTKGPCTKAFLLLMMSILHGLIYQSPRNCRTCKGVCIS